MIKRYALGSGEAHTIREWAKISGVPYASLSLRLRRGMPLERAIIVKPNSQRVTYDGQTLTFKEWEKATGVSARLLYSRILNGWSAERALTESRNVWAPSDTGIAQP